MESRELTENIKKLVGEYQVWHEEIQPKESGSFIVVDEVAARVASFYEKIRSILDWREEHLLRKTAIERILKRRMLFGQNGTDFAEPFLHELIRGGHFPNNRIEIQKIDEVQKIINKHLFLIDQNQALSHAEAPEKLEGWVLSIAACEIEEVLAPRKRERALIEFMAQDLVEKVNVEDRNHVVTLTEREKFLQLYVAVERALFKLDNPIITYHLLEKFYPDWRNASQETLTNVAQNLGMIHQSIEKILAHSLSERFYRLAERQDTIYLILGDILSENVPAFLDTAAKPESFELEIQKTYTTRLKSLSKKVRRAAVYSTLSVFFSKVFVALLVEIPFDRYITHELRLSPLVASVAIPSFLMLALVMSTRTSTQENFQKLMMGIMKITYGTERKETFTIVIPRLRKSMLNFFVGLVYWLSFFGSFGLIIWALRRYDFSAMSIAIFLMFISLVAFAGTKIRQRAKELMVTDERGGMLNGIFDVFSLPMIQVGKWLSGQLVKYNLLVVIFNFLVEAPFQVFVEFIEQWRSFLKEKKEEIH